MLDLFIGGYEALYRGCAVLTGGYGSALFALSLVTALLLVPLKRAAERVAGRHRRLLDAMRPSLDAIRRESRGLERHERLQRLYRRYGYSPIQSLAGSAGLFVQVPVLFLAYYMLSNCAAIKGVAFGPVADLGRADGLLAGVNALPIVMTLVNLAALFTTPGWTRREQMQGLGLAGFFLLLLYAMPAALLIFWTTNNLISLAGNLLAPVSPSIEKWGRRWPSTSKAVEWLLVWAWPALLALFAFLFLRWAAARAALAGVPAAAFAESLRYGLLLTAAFAAALYALYPRWLRALAATGVDAALNRLNARAFGGQAGWVYAGAVCAMSTLLVLHGPLSLYRTAPDLIGMEFGAFSGTLATWFVGAMLAAGYVWFAAPTAMRGPLAGLAAFLSAAALANSLFFMPKSIRLNGFALESLPAGGALMPGWLDAAVAAGAAGVVAVACGLRKARGLAIGFAVAACAMLAVDAVEMRDILPKTGIAASKAATVVAPDGGEPSLSPAAARDIASSQVYPAALPAFKKRGPHEIVDGRSVVFSPGPNRILYGPYTSVRAGTYDVTVDYAYLEGGREDEASVTFEMLNFPPAASGPFARLPLPRAAGRVVIPGIEIPSGDLAREVEFRFQFKDPAVGFRVDAVTLARHKASDRSEAPEPCYFFSRTNTNHLFVMLDTFDASRIPALLAADPSLRERLDGFVWYTDAMPVGNETSLSVMAMYGGGDFMPRSFNRRADAKRWDKAFAAMSRLPREFIARGDRVAMPDFYGIPWLNARYTDATGKPPRPWGEVVADPGRLHLTPGPDDRMIPVWMRRIGMADDEKNGDMTPFCLAVSLFRAAPGFLKMAVYDEGRWLGTERGASSVYSAGVLLQSLRLGMLADASVVDDGPGTYNAVFSLLVHAPYLLGPDHLIPLETTQSPDHSMLHALRMLADFFDWMKRVGVYDNTQIILASDHGNANLFGPERPETLEMIARSEGKTLPPALDPIKRELIRMRALTLRKKPGDRGALREDGGLFMTGADIPDMLLADAAGEAELVRRMQDPNRERVFAYRPSNAGKQTNDTDLLEPFKNIRVRGSYRDYGNWELMDD